MDVDGTLDRLEELARAGGAECSACNELILAIADSLQGLEPLVERLEAGRLPGLHADVAFILARAAAPETALDKVRVADLVRRMLAPARWDHTTARINLMTAIELLHMSDALAAWRREPPPGLVQLLTSDTATAGFDLLSAIPPAVATLHVGGVLGALAAVDVQALRALCVTLLESPIPGVRDFAEDARDFVAAVAPVRG